MYVHTHTLIHLYTYTHTQTHLYTHIHLYTHVTCFLAVGSGTHTYTYTHTLPAFSQLVVVNLRTNFILFYLVFFICACSLASAMPTDKT